MIPLLNMPFFQWISREAPGESELPLINPTDGLCLAMVVVHRAHGFRFAIYTLDHEPAHVHIVGERAKRRSTSWERRSA